MRQDFSVLAGALLELALYVVGDADAVIDPWHQHPQHYKSDRRGNTYR
jgi:hypothetical protein